jgi:hypothetical protein
MDSRNGGWPGIPAIWNNASGALYTRGTGEHESGWAGFHPGANGYISDYRFTAPDAGTYNVALDFQGSDIYGASTQVFVRTNTTVLYSDSINGSGYSSRKSFSGTVSLSAGQVLDIAVTAGPWNDQDNDSTAIRGTIAAVPEPETYAMMLAGLGLIGCIRRRSKQK